MNEIMTALEAMIRRVVKEEIVNHPVVLDDRDFRKGLKDYVDNNKPEFAAIVSQGALEMPWFDDAIKAEVAAALVNMAFTVRAS